MCTGRWVLAACFVAGCGFEKDFTPPNTEANVACALQCHGADNSNAPPKSLSGATETTATAVGAHEPHMDAASPWHAQVKCADCHVVPAQVASMGHIDGDNRAEVTFSARVGASAWNGVTCTTGCHGNPAWGGTKPAPNWTLVDHSQSQCGSCHGAPPPAPHPSNTNCGACHPTMEENQLLFRDPSRHIDGKIDVVPEGSTGGCSSCHGSTANAAPPRDLLGNTASPKVGAHQAHLRSSNWHHVVPCSTCHVVPLTADAPGHRDLDNIAEIIFDTLNPAATYANGTCSSLYCHGNGRSNNGTATWTSTQPYVCGRCHSVTGSNMSGKHDYHINEKNLKCDACHATVVDAALTIINANLHINGVHEVKMVQGTFNSVTRDCSNIGCHGTENWTSGD